MRDFSRYKGFVFFCQISRVNVACANLCCIIVELTLEILLFAEPCEILFLHNLSNYFTRKMFPDKGGLFLCFGGLFCFVLFCFLVFK